MDLRRSERTRRPPGYLEDYERSEDVRISINRLMAERQAHVVEAEHNLMRAAAIITERGSRTALTRIDRRLTAVIEALRIVTTRLLDQGTEEQELRKFSEEFANWKTGIETAQDNIADYLEERRDEAPSIFAEPDDNGRGQGPAPKVKKSPSHAGEEQVGEEKTLGEKPSAASTDPTDPDDDESDESETATSSKPSTKLSEARIKVRVATLRVKQEKRRYQEECQLREAQHRLSLREKEDEAERAVLEEKLRSEVENSEGGSEAAAPSRKVPVPSFDKPVKPKASIASSITADSTQPPLKRIVDSLHVNPRHAGAKAMQVPRDPIFSSTPYVMEKSDDLRRFFQGLAKPQLPKFNGDREKYHDWRSQFDIFIHQAEVPVRFKMMMLKNSLTGSPLKLVDRLGYTDLQYSMALSKLDQRFGGEKRLLQRYLDAVIAMPAVKEDDLKNLEELSNCLCDIVAKLAESNHEQELSGMSALYTIVLKKVPDSLLVRYQETHSTEKEDGLAVFAHWLNKQVCIRTEMAELKETVKPKPHGHIKNSASAKKTYQNAAHSSATSTKAVDADQQKRPATATTMAPKKSSAGGCLLCQERHNTFECKKWLSMSVDDRWAMAKEKNMCFRCLMPGHRGRGCLNSERCDVEGCLKTHHRHLHYSNEEGGTSSTGSKKPNNTCFGISEEGKVLPRKIALRMVPVWIKGTDGKKVKINAFLDEGSDSTYLREGLARSLGIAVEDSNITVSTIGRKEKMSSGYAIVDLESLDGKITRQLGVRTLAVLCQDLPVPNWRRHRIGWPHLEGIDFPTQPKQKTIDMLIGADHPELTLALEERVGKLGDPVARRTPLGWTCIGALDNSITPHCHSLQAYYLQTEPRFSSLDEDLRRLWNFDVLERKRETIPTKEEKLALQKAKDSRNYIDGRYEVAIPWEEETPSLPNNRKEAENRLKSLERTLRRRPELASRYSEVMEGNITKGYLRKVDDGSIGRWYLPHFAVIREDKATTKVRIVFDSASKTDGISLNDTMLAGPKLQLDIVDILVRFRHHAIAIVGDIKEMFSQVALLEKDRIYHRVLWRRLDPHQAIQEYEAMRLTFGDKASPFLAQFIVRSHAEEYQTSFPLASSACLNSMYMDDVITSVDTVKEAITLRDQMIDLLNGAGFEIRRWCSNNMDVLKDIPEESCASGVNIQESELPCIKTLGVQWNASNDQFQFSFMVKKPETHTKRTLLSKIATLFDPLQILAPFVIRAKMMLQRAWLQGLDWDEEFPEELSEDVNIWLEELPLVEEFALPRCYCPGEVLHQSLHTFTDASSLAYAAVTFIRQVLSNGSVLVNFVLAKARVTPLKTISIPRLELMAAILGVRLASKVSTLLEIPSSHCIYWTDSMDVVYWIHGQSRHYKPFVAHRVAEIQEESLPVQWRHVPGEQNPADLATRGVKMEMFIRNNVWLKGPDFLYNSEEDWPQPATDSKGDYSELAQAEISKTHSQVSTSIVSEPMPVIDPNKYSSWTDLVRVTAWVMRYLRRLREAAQNNSHLPPIQRALDVDEIEKAEKHWVKQAQAQWIPSVAVKEESFPKQRALQALTPFVDEDGLIRVGGRLQKSDLPYDSKHPIILPQRHHITTLIVRSYHFQGRHVRGVNAVLADTRQRFWIVKGREEVKRVQRDCFTCKQLKKKPAQQIMAPLPPSRITVSLRAFAKSGVDFAGPFITKITRRVSAKRYLCLFTCASSRAVHLEMAYALDTSSFLQAFSRMVARRGKPEEVISDNGTNFVGANRELGELIQALDQDRIIDDAATQGIRWRFNPPLGSHHGGFFEALIKSAKKALQAILGDASVTDEELQTAIAETEGLMNSRPLTYCSGDHQDDNVLTPNHFLFGQAGGQLAPRGIEELAYNPRNRWRYIQDLVNRVWKRWMREYLNQLQGRGKWQTESRDLQVGDIVSVVDPSNPKGKWPLGRIVETFESRDGHVRSVRVLARGKEFVRPITRICPLLPVEESSAEV